MRAVKAAAHAASPMGVRVAGCAGGTVSPSEDTSATGIFGATSIPAGGGSVRSPAGVGVGMAVTTTLRTQNLDIEVLWSLDPAKAGRAKTSIKPRCIGL